MPDDDLKSESGKPLGTVIGVFARANHPVGYGGFYGKNYRGEDDQTAAHGYVVVVVRCRDFDQLEAVRTVLGNQPLGAFDPSMGREYLVAFDPWGRGDKWYAGPYELVWAAKVADVDEVRGMYPHSCSTVGDRPSYGDNRAMAYLDASEVLIGEFGGPSR